VKPLTTRQRETVFALCSDLGLDRRQRLEVASYVLNFECQTTKGLGVVALDLLIAAFRGALYIQAHYPMEET